MLQLLSNSPYLSVSETSERSDAPVNMEAQATIEISLPPSKVLTKICSSKQNFFQLKMKCYYPINGKIEENILERKRYETNTNIHRY